MSRYHPLGWALPKLNSSLPSPRTSTVATSRASITGLRKSLPTVRLPKRMVDVSIVAVAILDRRRANPGGGVFRLV